MAERPAAPDESRTIGLMLSRGADAPASAEHVKQLQAVRAGTRPPDGEEGISLGTASVSMKRLPNAGWARSASAGARTTSA
jgi:hypothetical protein